MLTGLRQLWVFLISVSSVKLTVQGYQPYQKPATSSLMERRILFNQAAIIASAVVVATVTPSISNAVISSKPCIQGEGDGCVDLADDNELIKMLQQKSSNNRERNEKVCTNDVFAILDLSERIFFFHIFLCLLDLFFESNKIYVLLSCGCI